MALASSTPQASYDQSASVFLDLSNELAEVLRRDNTSFISRVGISGEATEVKHSWTEDQLNTNVATAAEAIDSSETTISVAAGHGVRFRIGDLITLNVPGYTEVMQVTDISTDDLTVVRGYGSTSGQAGTAGTTDQIVIISHAVQESQDAPADASRTRTVVDNYTQIIQYGINIGHTLQAIMKSGVADEFAYQTAQRVREAYRELDMTVIRGIKSASAGSDTVYHTMGGIIEFASQATGNTSTTAEALTPTVVNGMVKQIWDDGGTPNFLLVGGKQKRAVSSFDASYRRSDYDSSRAGYQVDRFLSDLGFELEVIVDPWVPDDVAIVGDLMKVKVMPLRTDALRVESLAKTGRSNKAQVTGQYTAEFRNAIETLAYHNSLT